ncbi:hypothetical protein LCGC14_2419210 [marine sediment metagenome]|uniref:Uncharacterized protein n=1 Tax=marine sediment metagenome TaxID=412755 RepID=A0A0F9E2A4_9ZZZZ
MAHRIDSYCGTSYVDTEAESMNGFYPVGPHLYELCLENQQLNLDKALCEALQATKNIEELGKRITRRDKEKNE